MFFLFWFDFSNTMKHWERENTSAREKSDEIYDFNSKMKKILHIQWLLLNVCEVFKT